MATVPDKSGNETGVDKRLSTYNRVVAGNPNADTVPQFSGEIVLDSTNNALWQAQNLDQTSWVQMTPGPGTLA